MPFSKSTIRAPWLYAQTGEQYNVITDLRLAVLATLDTSQKIQSAKLEQQRHTVFHGMPQKPPFIGS
jgi:hypothetical protein